MRALLLLLSAALPLSAFTQGNEADSLRQALHKATDDTSFAHAAYQLARHHYFQGEQDSTRQLADHGLARLARSRMSTTARSVWTGQLWRIKGMGWFAESRYDSALTAFQHMYRSAEQAKNAKDMGAALSYQGFALREMEDPAGARELVHQAMQVLRTLPPGPDLANCYHELGSIHADLHEVDSSVMWYTKAAEAYKAQGNLHHLANTWLNQGECLFNAQRWQEADSLQRLATTLLDHVQDPMGYARWVAGEARRLLHQGDHARALPLLDSAVTLAQEDLNAAHHLLLLRSLAHARAGHMEQAFRDQLLAKQARLEDMDLAKVRATEKARSDAAHERDRLLHTAELARERLWKRGALLVCALTALLAVVWYRSARARKRAAAMLQRKNQEIQEAQAELIQNAKLREAEQVRSRIARDIHDDIGATLTKIALVSGMAEQRAQDVEGSQKAFLRIAEHAKGASRALSDAVWAVDPQRDTHQGMLDHVRDLTKRLLGDNGIRFQLDLRTDSPAVHISPALKRDLHLVLNECCNNILKYAHAKLVTVTLHLRNGSFELRVDDDGIGFDPTQVPDRGNGLRNMPARMAAHGARLTISSAPGKGTALHATGPLH